MSAAAPAHVDGTGGFGERGAASPSARSRGSSGGQRSPTRRSCSSRLRGRDRALPAPRLARVSVDQRGRRGRRRGASSARTASARCPATTPRGLRGPAGDVRGQGPADRRRHPLHVHVVLPNFPGFTAIGVILVAMIGVGVAELSGLVGGLIRKLVAISPPATAAYSSCRGSSRASTPRRASRADPAGRAASERRPPRSSGRRRMRRRHRGLRRGILSCRPAP